MSQKTFTFLYVREQRCYISVKAGSESEAEALAHTELQTRQHLSEKERWDESDDPGEMSLEEEEA